MAKTETKQDKTMQPTAGQKAPSLTHEQGLPRELTLAQRTEVLAKVRGALPAEAESLEAHFKYTDAKPTLPDEEKARLSREVDELRAWKRQVEDRARGLKEQMSYWFTLFGDDAHKANQSERQIPSVEAIADKTLDFLLLPR